MVSPQIVFTYPLHHAKMQSYKATKLQIILYVCLVFTPPPTEEQIYFVRAAQEKNLK